MPKTKLAIPDLFGKMPEFEVGQIFFIYLDFRVVTGSSSSLIRMKNSLFIQGFVRFFYAKSP